MFNESRIRSIMTARGCSKDLSCPCSSCQEKYKKNQLVTRKTDIYKRQKQILYSTLYSTRNAATLDASRGPPDLSNHTFFPK